MDHPIDVLLVEDNPADAELVEDLLSEHEMGRYRVAHAPTLSKALILLKEQDFHVALVDLSLPDATGLDTVNNVRLIAPSTPIVVLSGLSDEAVSIRAVEMGAQDYLVKGQVDGNILSRTIRYAIERKRSEERLAYLAHYDQLTGLSNRTLFKERVSYLISQARRNNTVIAVMFLDLDRFKSVNDTLGHDKGDLLLIRVAERLRASARESDTVARLGGDEFAVVLSGIKEERAVITVAQRIKEAFTAPLVVDGKELLNTASIGIALYPRDGETLEELVRCADLAMYRAKDCGRNTYQFYDQQMTARAAEHLTLASKLRLALDRQEFRLHFQPLLEIASGKVVAVEALLRWKHEGKLVPPLQFIPTLEQINMIVPVEEWVLYTACSQVRAWQAAGFPPMRVAVNLSSKQFGQRQLPGTIARVLKETGLEPDLLELELTERLVMGDVDQSAEILAELREMGVRVTIDDFGTGYSSLTHLRKFPVNTLKIDHAFIKDVPANADDAAIVKAIILLAHSLRMTVIAEGVETEAQLEYLHDMGCDAFQGFLFSPALPPGVRASASQSNMVPELIG